MENFSVNKTIIQTINPHSYCVAKKDSFYSQALIQSNILLPDGIGIVWAIKVMTGITIKRISGFDLHLDLLQRIQKEGGKVFYMGSSIETLNKIKDRLKVEYPNIIVGIYSPPYKTTFTIEENYSILASIKDFKPDVLFVGMTAPKQEKWVHQHKEKIDANIIASIGAVFDFYAGTIQRPGKFWIKLGLEWLLRLLQEPSRLWRRTLISTPIFIWEVLKEKLKMTFLSSRDAH